MICPMCGMENPDSNKFCNSCGGLLEKHSQKKSKSTLFIAIAIVCVIAIVGVVLFLPSGGTPADVVNQNFQLIKEGQIAKAGDLYADSTTLQPLSGAKKESFIASNERALNSNDFKLLDFKILSTTMVNPDRYIVSGTMTYTTTNFYGSVSQSNDSFSHTVVKVNGKWMIVYDSSQYS